VFEEGDLRGIGVVRREDGGAPLYRGWWGFDMLANSPGHPEVNHLTVKNVRIWSFEQIVVEDLPLYTDLNWLPGYGPDQGKSKCLTR
jgi:hypothetical protein